MQSQLARSDSLDIDSSFSDGQFFYAYLCLDGLITLPTLDEFFGLRKSTPAPSHLLPQTGQGERHVHFDVADSFSASSASTSTRQPEEDMSDLMLGRFYVHSITIGVEV
jgi:hypothetical protein